MTDILTSEERAERDAASTARQLVQRAQNREPGAMDALVRRYQTRLRSTVRQRLGDDLRRHVESMDVVQETFVQAIQAIDTLEVRFEGSVNHWLKKIALHVIYGYREHYQAVKRDIVREEPLDDTVVERCAGPGTTVVGREEFEMFLRALSKLPSPQRELVQLRQGEGLPWRDVARRTGYASGDAARMSFQRVKRELQRAMRSA